MVAGNPVRSIVGVGGGTRSKTVKINYLWVFARAHMALNAVPNQFGIPLVPTPPVYRTPPGPPQTWYNLSMIFIILIFFTFLCFSIYISFLSIFLDDTINCASCKFDSTAIYRSLIERIRLDVPSSPVAVSNDTDTFGSVISFAETWPLLRS